MQSAEAICIYYFIILNSYIDIAYSIGFRRQIERKIWIYVP